LLELAVRAFELFVPSLQLSCCTFEGAFGAASIDRTHVELTHRAHQEQVEAAEAAQLEAAAAAGLLPDGEEAELNLVEDLEGKMQRTPQKRLEQIVRLDQAQAAAILKDWMRREEAA